MARAPGIGHVLVPVEVPALLVVRLHPAPLLTVFVAVPMVSLFLQPQPPTFVPRVRLLR